MSALERLRDHDPENHALDDEPKHEDDRPQQWNADPEDDGMDDPDPEERHRPDSNRIRLADEMADHHQRCEGSEGLYRIEVSAVGTRSPERHWPWRRVPIVLRR